jgi:hypothetical protein
MLFSPLTTLTTMTHLHQALRHHLIPIRHPKMLNLKNPPD